MLKDQFARLLARKLSGEASPEELEELQILLSGDAEAQYMSELLTVYWANSNPLPDISTSSFAKDHFKELLLHAKEIESGEKTDLATQKTSKERNAIVSVMKRVSYAAAVAGIIISAYWIVNTGKPKPKEFAEENKKSEVIAGRGARSHLFLPDGSQVWLNSESKLTYKENFNDTIREVELEGEAFFDVVKDKKHPFIVHTSGIDIRVLGTRFNVKSYPREPTIETTLLRGMIEVSNKNDPNASKIILQPHQKMIFDKQENLLSKDEMQEKNSDSATHIHHVKTFLTTVPATKSDSTVVETSWVYNKLIFDGDTFTELAAKMERWFNKRIYFKNQKVAGYRFTGVFRNENIEEALQALQLIAPFTYKISGNDVEISKN